VLSYEETSRWREHALGTGEGLLAAAAELAQEEGTSVEETRAGILEMNALYDTMIRRFFLVAEAI
jgi:hypothetical protein